mmetsp:Transcript_58080/g.176953  ORF Transcript_58080/g.176953 Transcript_58080/m.176953 type:complete len:533 (-) Transcript_58080:215-1813(-)
MVLLHELQQSAVWRLYPEAVEGQESDGLHHAVLQVPHAAPGAVRGLRDDGVEVAAQCDVHSHLPAVGHRLAKIEHPAVRARHRLHQLLAHLGQPPLLLDLPVRCGDVLDLLQDLVPLLEQTAFLFLLVLRPRFQDQHLPGPILRRPLLARGGVGSLSLTVDEVADAVPQVVAPGGQLARVPLGTAPLLDRRAYARLEVSDLRRARGRHLVGRGLGTVELLALSLGEIDLLRGSLPRQPRQRGVSASLLLRQRGDLVRERLHPLGAPGGAGAKLLVALPQRLQARGFLTDVCALQQRLGLGEGAPRGLRLQSRLRALPLAVPGQLRPVSRLRARGIPPLLGLGDRLLNALDLAPDALQLEQVQFGLELPSFCVQGHVLVRFVLLKRHAFFLVHRVPLPHVQNAGVVLLSGLLRLQLVVTLAELRGPRHLLEMLSQLPALPPRGGLEGSLKDKEVPCLREDVDPLQMLEVLRLGDHGSAQGVTRLIRAGQDLTLENDFLAGRWRDAVGRRRGPAHEAHQRGPRHVRRLALFAVN